MGGISFVQNSLLYKSVTTNYGAADALAGVGVLEIYLFG